MIHSLHNVINIDNGSIIKRDGIGLENISGLVVSEPAAFDMVRVICEIYLQTMINSTGET